MADYALREELIDAGAAVLAATDDLGMQAQGAMWVLDHSLGDWRYYLVTSLVDTIGRRKTYKLLVDIFERIDLPRSMTVEDVHLGSPRDDFFRVISRAAQVTNSRAYFENCAFNDVRFDGVIYRSVRSPPSESEAQKIERRFSKQVRDLVASR